MLRRTPLLLGLLCLTACEPAPRSTQPEPPGPEHTPSPRSDARLPDGPPFEVVGIGHMPGYDRVLVEIQTQDGGHFELMAHARPDTMFAHVREIGGDESEWTVSGHFLREDAFECHVGVSARDACRITETLPAGAVRLETPSGLVLENPTREQIVAHTNRNAAADALSLLMGGHVDRDGVGVSYLAAALEDYLGVLPRNPLPRINIQKIICGLAAAVGAMLPYTPQWAGPLATALGLVCSALLLLEGLELTDNEYGCESDWNCDGIPDDEDPPEEDDPMDFPCSQCPRIP